MFNHISCSFYLCGYHEDVIQHENNSYTGRFIMYYGITKIYYRETEGHVFTKPVQTEGTTQIFFSPQ